MSTESSLLSSDSATLLGHVAARLFSEPLRPLDRSTSYGFDVIDFARDVLAMPLDPWQEWLVVHAGELLPDGRPRFRKVLVIVARQNGKTHLLKVLALYWLFVEMWTTLLGISTNLLYAKEPWDAVHEIAQATPELADEVVRHYTDNNNPHLLLTGGRKYRISAATRRAGRSLSVDRLIVDEGREHHTWDVWNAAYNAMSARPYGQAWIISNQGDDRSTLLDAFRASFLERTDPQLGGFEWSAVEGSSPEDPHALAAANPNLGRRILLENLLADAASAVAAGGTQLASFLTEIMCIRVHSMDSAVDPVAWERCYEEGDLSGVRSRVALCLDVAPDELHVTLAAAAVLPDGRTRVEIVEAWEGADAVQDARRALPGIVKRVKPRVTGWFPAGPAAALAADFTPVDGVPRVKLVGKVEPITAAVPAVCMGFATAVRGVQVVHNADPLLTDQTLGASKLWKSEVWQFMRKGVGHCDSTYAAAGAVHLARTIPALGKPTLRVVTPS
jgi:hypothetical protein